MCSFSCTLGYLADLIETLHSDLLGVLHFEHGPISRRREDPRPPACPARRRVLAPLPCDAPVDPRPARVFGASVVRSATTALIATV